MSVYLVIQREISEKLNAYTNLKDCIFLKTHPEIIDLFAYLKQYYKYCIDILQNKYHNL